MLVWNFIGITSSNLEESVRFYRLLGVPFPDWTGEDHHEAIYPNGMCIALDSVALMTKLGYSTDVKGNRMTMAFEANSPTEVDETYAAIVAAGFQGAVEPWDAFWGQRYCTVIDPDGNKVDLCAKLPTASAETDSD